MAAKKPAFQRWAVHAATLTVHDLRDSVDETDNSVLLTEAESDEYEEALKAVRRWNALIGYRAMYFSGRDGELDLNPEDDDTGQTRVD
jgi:hypothetical protein